MHTFFHGWRRKSGVAALVMALVAASIWVRSTVTGDEFTVYDMQFKSFAGTFERSDFLWYDDSSLGRAETRHVYWRIQYAWIATPLTLLSVYLLLWKPRKPSCPN